MKIFKNSELKNQVLRPVLTIGTFDGVHIGHQEILKRLIEVADEINGESVLFTFYPHPREVIFPDSHGLKMITSQNEKMEILGDMGVENVILFPFTKAFSNLSAEEFIKKVLVDEIGISKIIIGYDHQYGNNREGDINLLRTFGEKYDFDVEEIPAQDIEDINVSSTKIRRALEVGDMKNVSLYLGREFEINGTVVEGNKLGRDLGYPTANITVDDTKKILPKNGVYVVRVILKGKSYKGMMNIGFNPTHNLQEKASVEAHIHDFNADIYGEIIKVQVLEKIRDEEKFSDLEELKEQLKKDEKYSLNY